MTSSLHLPLTHLLSADERLLRRIPSAGIHARVHSVFRRVVNLMWQPHAEAGSTPTPAPAPEEMITFACEGLDNAPQTLLVRASDWSPWVTLSAGQHIECPIDTTQASVWQGVWPVFQTHPHWPQTLDRLEQVLRTHGQTLFWDSSPAQGLERTLQLRLQHHATHLCRALSCFNAPRLAEVDEHVQALLGLGQGLTPSGDDFLLGLLTALHWPGNPLQHHPLCAHLSTCIQQSAPGLTHDISNAALQQAAQGRVRESILNLCAALLTGDETLWHPALQQVLAIGSSSGADMAYGLWAGWRLQGVPIVIA